MSLQFKRNDAAAAAANNVILDEGEPGFERDTGKMKIGRKVAGVLQHWNDLPYFGGVTTLTFDEITDATALGKLLGRAATAAAGRTALGLGSAALSTAAFLLDRANHTGTQSADTLTDGTANKAFLAAERTKLTGIATAATANATDAALRDRATHTGAQTSATISDLTEAVQDIVGAFIGGTAGVTVTYNDAGNTFTITGPGVGGGGLDAEGVRDAIGVALIGTGLIAVTVNDAADTITISTTATANSSDAALRDRSTHTGTQSIDTLTESGTGKVMTAAERTKLTGIASGATVNSADATLLARANHTGSQLASTVSDFTEAAQDAVAAMLVAGSNVTLTYNDAANTLTVAATGGGSALPSYEVKVPAITAGVPLTITHSLNNWNIDAVLTRSYLQSGALTGATAGEIVRDVKISKYGPDAIIIESDVNVAANEYILTVNQFAAPSSTVATAGTIAAGTVTTASIPVTLTGGTDAGIGNAGVNWYRNGTFIASTAGDSYTHTGLTANTAYTLTAKRFNYRGTEGAVSNTITPSTAAASTPPPFDSKAESTSVVGVATANNSWTHGTVGGTAASNLGIVAVICSNGGSQSGVPGGTPTASIGGVSLPFLGYQLMSTAAGGWVALFAGLGVPAGAGKAALSSITAGAGFFGTVFALSFVYTGVGSIGSLITAGAVSSANALTIPSGPTHRVFGVFANFQNNAYSAPTFTQRSIQSAVVPAWIAGDMVGVASTNFAATEAAAIHWAGAGIDMLP